MRFFDYIFYRVSRYYTKRWRDDQGYWYGMLFVVLMWVFHLGTIALLAAIYWEPANHYIFELRQDKHMTDPSKLVPVLIIVGLVALRYMKFKKYKDLDEVWGNEDAKQGRRRAWLIAAYTVVTFAVTMWLAIYRKYYM